MARRHMAHAMGDARLSATHHMWVLSLAIASSVGESIVQHVRAVKSDLTAQPGRPPRWRPYMRSHRAAPKGSPRASVVRPRPRPALEDILERRRP